MAPAGSSNAPEFPRKAEQPDEIDAAGEQADDVPIEDDAGYRGRLLAILRGLPPSGFERICQRLLARAASRRSR